MTQIPPVATSTGPLYKAEVYQSTNPDYSFSVLTTKLDDSAPEIPDSYFTSSSMAGSFAKQVAELTTATEAQELIDTATGR